MSKWVKIEPDAEFANMDRSTDGELVREYWTLGNSHGFYPLWSISLRASNDGCFFLSINGKESKCAWWEAANYSVGAPAFVLRRAAQIVLERVKP